MKGLGCSWWDGFCQISNAQFSEQKSEAELQWNQGLTNWWFIHGYQRVGWMGKSCALLLTQHHIAKHFLAPNTGRICIYLSINNWEDTIWDGSCLHAPPMWKKDGMPWWDLPCRGIRAHFTSWFRPQGYNFLLITSLLWMTRTTAAFSFLLPMTVIRLRKQSLLRDLIL